MTRRQQHLDELGPLRHTGLGWYVEHPEGAMLVGAMAVAVGVAVGAVELVRLVVWLLRSSI